MSGGPAGSTIHALPAPADEPATGPHTQQDTHVVPISALRPGYSPRLEGEDPQHVHLLTETEASLPPILVHRATMQVIDGMHRLLAAQLRQDHTIRVRYFDGDDREAFVAAVRANMAHGLPLTLADREAAAARIIKVRPNASDRSIAAITGLAPRTVGAIRRRAGAEDAQAPVRIGRDGRVRPLSSAEGRRMAREIITKRPDASLREIAKLAGISPATVRDVRERIARGDDPVPARLRAEPDTPPVRVDERTAGLNGDGERRARRDRALLLQNLSKDPSLRFTERGRKVLRWLFAQSGGPEGWQDIAAEIPAHSAYLVAEVARAFAEDWVAFAEHLERRLQASA